MRSLFCCLVVLSLGASATSAFAQEEVFWQHPSTGYFDDAANWHDASGNPVAPTTDMKLNFMNTPRASSILFRQDATVDTLYFGVKENSTVPQLYDFDLCGHTLTITNIFDCWQHYKGPTSCVTFRNGTLAHTGPEWRFNFTRSQGTGWGGTMVLTNMTFSLPTPWRIYSKSYPSELRICGGTKATIYSISDQRTQGYGFTPKLVVTGKGTELTCTAGLDLYYNGRFEFTDGAVVNASSVKFSNSSDGARGIVSNATVNTTGWVSLTGGGGSGSHTLFCGGARFVNTGGDNVNLTLAAGQNVKTHGHVLEVTGDASIAYTGAGFHFLELSRWQNYSNELWVGDATITMSRLTLGGYTGKIGGVDMSGAASNNCVRIYGRRAKMVFSDSTTSAGNFNYGCRLQYDIPANGFADASDDEQVPLQFPSGGISAGDNPLDASQRNRLVIDADAFTRKHPQTRVTLMTTAKDSSVAFEKLKTNFFYSGKERFKGEVSYDTTHLYYTSAKIPGLMLLFR